MRNLFSTTFDMRLRADRRGRRPAGPSTGAAVLHPAAARAAG
jgi:hypothetical protein